MPDVGTIVPPWLALIMGSLALVVLAGHLLALNNATDMDPRRRRIRSANAVLMMLVVPFVAYGFGIATPSHARAFVYTWVVTAALLFMVIFVAMLDMLNSWTLHRKQLRSLRHQMALTRGREAQAAAILAAAQSRRTAPRPDDKPGHGPGR